MGIWFAGWFGIREARKRRGVSANRMASPENVIVHEPIRRNYTLRSPQEQTTEAIIYEKQSRDRYFRRSPSPPRSFDEYDYNYKSSRL
ncbi:unnamed protein product [Anisakis simplex]|uniref:Uncharacterized protein n=1 Tax=Anisakis simplex TaxID=6269 RepID=A0A0M3KEH4_ANISI|nr:unnamed protein product [Anisakis simplex]